MSPEIPMPLGMPVPYRPLATTVAAAPLVEPVVLPVPVVAVPVPVVAVVPPVVAEVVPLVAVAVAVAPEVVVAVVVG